MYKRQTVHRSFNKGDTWTDISNDLTKGGKKGNVPYGTLTCIDESTFNFGKIITGSDDGNIVLTQNSGVSWENISNDLPSNLWVSRVIFSKHKDQRIYTSLNGYRNNDFRPYLYVSDDNGISWNEISTNLPLSPINVVREDINNIFSLFMSSLTTLMGDKGRLAEISFHEIPLSSLTYKYGLKSLFL